MFRRKFVRQENIKDCGVACLLMIMKHYGGNYPVEQLREMMKTNKSGTTALNIIKVAKRVGFDARGYRCNDYKNLSYPAITHVILNKSYHHFVVIEKVDLKNKIITIADPALGIKKYSFDDFDQIWTKTIITLHPIRKIDNIDITKNIKQTIFQIIKPYKKLFALILVLSIIYTVLNILNIFYFKIIIDNTTLSVKTHIYLFIFFLLMMIIKLITDYLKNRLLIYITKQMDNHLMEMTFKHLISLPWQYFNSRTTGDIIARLNDLSYVKELISKSAIIILVDLVLVLGSFIVMININPYLCIITIVTFLIYLLVVFIYNRSIKYFIMLNQEYQALVSSSLVETITGINTIKNLGIEHQIYHNVIAKYHMLVNNIYDFDKKYNLIRVFKDFISNSGLLVILLLGGILISSQSLSIGNFIIFNFFLNFFLEPMKNIFEIEPLLRASSNALVRTSEFYNIEKDKVCGLNNINKGDIILNNLTFSYNGKDQVISDINININHGEKIIINGPSGCGKSTIAKMLMRYLDVLPNQIRIDGKDALNYSLPAIRNNICYVSQDEMIFTDSLYNNVALYRNVDIKKVEEVLHITKAIEIPIKHNLDYHMLLEENGANLSGGERQRLMIARALLKDNKIFIFDETMSEMNVSLERSIMKEVFANYQDKTFIVISHRLDNADLYDRVITLNNINSLKKEGVAV